MAGSAGFGVEVVFDDLSYGSAADSESVAQLWLDKHNKSFGQFVNGVWSQPEGRMFVDIKKPSTGSKLASVQHANGEDVTFAVENSNQAFKGWSELSCNARAQHLYSIARTLQKHQSLLAVVEALGTGQPTRETRGASAPAAIRAFYHNAGWAGIRDDEFKRWKPCGVVVVVVPEWLPLASLAGRVASALASGSTVLVLPPASAPLSCLFLADICAQTGLPPGVFNVVNGEDAMRVLNNDKVDKIFFSGTAHNAIAVIQAVAGQGKVVAVELSGQSTVLVMEGADLDSVVEGIVEASCYNSGQSPHCGSRLLIQEPVYQAVVDKLKRRMARLTGGDNMDKNNDLGPLVNEDAFLKIKGLVERAKGKGAEIYQPFEPKQNCYPPTLVTNVQTSSEIYLADLSGPVMMAIPFRTLKEGVTLANHTPYGMAASVWTEDLTVGLEAAALMQVSTVWVNGHHMYDAASGSGGSKASGYGRTGGREGLYEYLVPSWQPRVLHPWKKVDKKFGAGSTADMLPGASVPGGPAAGDGPGIDKTYKLYYGGGQKRPDSGASRVVTGDGGAVCGYVPEAGKKDVRNAVEVAVKAAGGWAKKEGHVRAQIMYYMAENLQARRAEFSGLLASMSGRGAASCEEEVDMASQRLFYWAAYCDKFGGEVQETQFYGLTVRKNESVGVIGVVCPETCPLLGFVSLMAPAVARGNAVVMVPSERWPLAGLAFHQILETSDMPGGVVNILTGSSDVLAKSLADHHDVGAVWYFGSQAGCGYVEFASTGNFKRTWTENSVREWATPEQGQGSEFLHHATSGKAVWLPMGSVFAN